MCIICVKKPGIKLPGLDLFERCFTANPDGAGFMFPEEGSIKIQKGLMTFEAFKEAYGSFLESKKDSILDLPVLLHFRIGTHGSQGAPEHTHPFPIVDDYSIMGQTNQTCKQAMMHNGIYNIGSVAGTYSKWSAENKETLTPSDTMEFAKKILVPLLQVPNWGENQSVLDLIGGLNGNCRLVIMDVLAGQAGNLRMWGTFSLAEDGMIYSNEGYKAPKTTYVAPREKDYFETHHWDYWLRKYVPNDKETGYKVLSANDVKVGKIAHLSGRELKDIVGHLMLGKGVIRGPVYNYREIKSADTEYEKNIMNLRKLAQSRFLGENGGYDSTIAKKFQTWYQRAVIYVRNPKLETTSKNDVHRIVLDEGNELFYLDPVESQLFYYDISTDIMVLVGEVLDWSYITELEAMTLAGMATTADNIDLIDKVISMDYLKYLSE